MNGIQQNGLVDPQLRAVHDMLSPYQAAHPNAQIDGANIEFENPLPWPDEEALLLAEAAG